MVKRAVFLAMLVLVVFSLGIAGAQDKNLKGEITNWFWATKNMDDWLTPAFNKLYPNIKVTTVPMGLPECHDKLFACVAAGSGTPDFNCIISDYMQKFIDQGGLVDLTAFVNKHSGEFPKYKVQVDSDESGRVFGVPFNSAPVGMWYRKDILDKYKLTLPTTWDEYLALGRVLKAKGVFVTSISVAGKGMDTSQHGEVGVHGLLVQEQGASYFDEHGNPILDSKESQRAMDLMYKMVKEGLAANVPQGAPSQIQLMDDSKLFSIMSAAWYVNALDYSVKPGSASYGNWRFAKMPAFEKGGPIAANLGGGELVLFKETPKDKAALAMKYIEFSCTNMQGAIANAQFGDFTSWLPSWKDPSVMNMTFKMTGNQQMNKVFAEIDPLVPYFRKPARFTEIQSILQSKMNAIFMGTVSVDVGLSQAQAQALE